MLLWNDIRFRYIAGSAAIAVFSLAVWSSCGRSVDKPAELVAAEKTLPETVDYNLHIKPILSDRCFACHGPDKAKQQAG
ncbi:hypothetical protein, partial [Nibrella saemangeumensis]|uniref:hypothetical protein n=1 Tax=Nibrella saemangeumensis TaxID=1084526 RepID=UPI0031EEFE6F